MIEAAFVKAVFVCSALAGALVSYYLARWGRVPCLTSFVASVALVSALIGALL